MLSKERSKRLRTHNRLFMDCKSIGLTSIGNILNFFSCTLLGWIVPLVITLSVVAFIWGMIEYFLNPNNEEKRKSGKGFMFWGLITLFVMVSMWGIVSVLSNTFGFKTSSTPIIPQLPQ